MQAAPRAKTTPRDVLLSPPNGEKCSRRRAEGCDFAFEIGFFRNVVASTVTIAGYR